MDCPDIDQIIDQARATTLDPWFAAHLVLCGECLADLWILRFLLELYADPVDEPEDPWEALDAQPREWMLWMMGDWPSFPEA